MNQGRGIVYLVGAGPGDPGLLTVRGAEVLGRADVVIYDHLASPRLLDLAPPDAIRICAGKSSGHCTLDQDQINTLLLEHAEAGRVVVRLKGGDPLVFGRGAEEAEHLASHQVPFQIVPGVTAGVGVTAYAGIPVTHRRSVLGRGLRHRARRPGSRHRARAFDDPASATRPRIDWPALARFPGTLVVYMGVTHLAAICRTLIKAGKDGETPAAVIESGTLTTQRVVEGTLATIAEEARVQAIRPPALLVVGQVVERRMAISWYESLPLVRPADRGHPPGGRGRPGRRGARGPRRGGAACTHRPDPAHRRSRARSTRPSAGWASTTGWSSRRAMAFGSSWSGYSGQGRDLRALGHLKLAAIGPGHRPGAGRAIIFAPTSFPQSFRSEALAEALAGQAAGRKILLARADRGRSLLKDELIEAGRRRPGARVSERRR